VVSGEEDWKLVTVLVNGPGDVNGNHRIRWEYVKDDSKTAGTDQVWLDTVTWTPLATGPGYSDWIASYGLSGDDALDLANPSGDGISNLMKYGLSLGPTTITSGVTDGVAAGMPAIMNSAGTYSFVFIKNAKASDPTYMIKSSTDLKLWEEVTVGIIETVLSDDVVKVVVTLPSGGVRFCRLIVKR